MNLFSGLSVATAPTTEPEPVGGWTGDSLSAEEWSWVADIFAARPDHIHPDGAQ